MVLWLLALVFTAAIAMTAAWIFLAGGHVSFDSGAAGVLPIWNGQLQAVVSGSGQVLHEFSQGQEITHLFEHPSGQLDTIGGNEAVAWDIKSGLSQPLEGPTKMICRVQYVEAWGALVLAGAGGEAFAFTAPDQPGTKLSGLTEHITQLQYVEA